MLFPSPVIDCPQFVTSSVTATCHSNHPYPFTAVFVAYYAIDGLLREHRFELVAFITAVVGVAIINGIANYFSQFARPNYIERLTDAWRLVSVP